MAALLDEGKIRTIVGCVPSQYSETWSALLACTESYSVMSEAEEIELLSILRPQFRVWSRMQNERKVDEEKCHLCRFKVQHLYPGLHLRGLTAVSSVAAVCTGGIARPNARTTKDQRKPVFSSRSCSEYLHVVWIWNALSSVIDQGMAWNSRPSKKRCGGKDLW